MPIPLRGIVEKEVVFPAVLIPARGFGFGRIEQMIRLDNGAIISERIQPVYQMSDGLYARSLSDCGVPCVDCLRAYEILREQGDVVLLSLSIEQLNWQTTPTKENSFRCEFPGICHAGVCRRHLGIHPDIPGAVFCQSHLVEMDRLYKDAMLDARYGKSGGSIVRFFKSLFF